MQSFGVQLLLTVLFSFSEVEMFPVPIPVFEIWISIDFILTIQKE
jgi:hypothetical protein